MISSAKMHRAEAGLKQLLPFRHQIEHILGNLLSADAEFSSPLTVNRDVRTVGLVVFGSDDGLCGAYNINIFKEALAAVNSYRAEYGDRVEVKIIPVGKKMLKAVSKIAVPGVSVVPVENVNSKTSGDDVRVFVQKLESEFVSGSFDRVEVLYMNFQSVSRQRLRRDCILPLTTEAILGDKSAVQCRPYIFEPDAQTIFVSVLPMFLLATMQEIFTENRASEQAARVMAMQSANDNAQKLLEQLRLEFNKLRQQSITTELLDILGGQVK